MNWQENTTLSVPVVEGDSVGRVSVDSNVVANDDTEEWG